MRYIGTARLALVGAAMVGFAGVSARADGVKSDWNGFYTGAQLGGAWSDIDWQYQNANYFNTNGPVVVGSAFDHGPDGVIGGILGGYDYRTGPWLLGLELTASAANMREERPSPFFPTLDTSTSQINWLTTATGRVGIVWEGWLVFAKGGWAGGEVTLRLLDRTAAVYGSEDQWANGWTLGGGLEYMLWDRVSLGVAYDYAELSIDNETVTCPACIGPGPGFGTPVVDGDVTVQSLMARLSFHQ